MTTRDDWDDWRESWQTAPEGAGPLARTLLRTRRARRTRIALRTGQVALVAAALVGIALALRHAASPLEIALGFTAGAAIALYAAAQIMVWRRARRFLAAPANRYLVALYEVRVRQVQFVQFAWGVLLLELVFLIPWWLGGLPVHAGQPAARIVVVGFWLPVAGILAFTVWSARLRRHAKADMRRLKTVQDRLDRDEPA